MVSMALGAVPRAAHAAGFSTSRFGSDHGSPALSNPYAVYFNPAAMGGMEGSQLTLDGTVALRTAEYTRFDSSLSPSDPAIKSDPAYVRANTGHNTLVNVIAAPFVGFVSDFGQKNLRFGIATYVPFGGAARWDQNQGFSGASTTPGALDGAQRWQNISGRQQSLYNTAAFALRLPGPRLTVGAGVSLVASSVRSVRARNPDGSDDVLSANGSLLEGRALLDVSGLTVAASVGVFWEATEDRRLRFGLAYLSQPGFGEMRMSGNFREQLGTVQPAAQPKNVDFLQSLPDVVRLGMAYKVDADLEVRADIVYERWSRMKHQCVVEPGAKCDVDGSGADLTGGKVIANFPRQWNDSVGLRAGAGYWIGSGHETELFGSGNFGTPAIPHKTADPAYFDSYTLGFSVGARQRITSHIYAALSYNYVYYLPFDVKPNQSQLYQYQQPSRTPAADGSYSAQIYFFNANLTFVF
jgi:long-chain fatty acid transport protein